MNPLAFTAGLFLGVYADNQKFRETVNKSIGGLLGLGVDAINGKPALKDLFGGVPEVGLDAEKPGAEPGVDQ